MVTDSELDTCVQSIQWSGGETVWLKIDLKRSYFVTVVVLSPKYQSNRVYVSNRSEFLMKTRCNQSSNRFHCSGSHQVRYVIIVDRRRYYGQTSRICEVEVFYKPEPTLPCQYLPYLPNSTTITDWKTATYTCINNLAPEMQTITCLPTGQWSETLKQCRRKCFVNKFKSFNFIYRYLAKVCPDLGHPIHGKISLPSEKTLRNTVSYSCSTCYRIHGNSRRHCQLADDGKSLKWSGSEPTCKGIRFPQ